MEVQEKLGEVADLACSCPHEALCKRPIGAHCEQMCHSARSKEMLTPVRVLRGRRNLDYRVACPPSSCPAFRSQAGLLKQ